MIKKRIHKRRGKGKGGAFERKICKRLSLWITHGKREDVFWRSAMSGGRATVAAKVGKDLARQAGDICAVAPEGHVLTDFFFVELKHYKDLAIDSFFLKQEGTLAKFWLKACREAGKYNKQPLMIACQNFMPIMVIVRPDVLDQFARTRWIRVVTLAPKLFSCDVFLFDDLLKQRFLKWERQSTRTPVTGKRSAARKNGSRYANTGSSVVRESDISE